MKKGQIIEGIVQRMDFPNKGIVETEEGVCAVKNALPGQRIQCAVNKVRKGKAEGRLMRVLESSPMECGSPCPHFGNCGGCTYLSLPYEEQLKIKESQVKKLLDSVLDGQGAWRFEGIKASPACFGYRNKMEFSFGDEIKDGPLTLGMHKRGSFYDIVSVTECRIIDEDYRKILCCVKDYFAGLQEQGVNIRFYHRLRHIGYLRHLLVRKAAKTGEILIALVTTTQIPGSYDASEAGAVQDLSEASGTNIAAVAEKTAGFRVVKTGQDMAGDEAAGDATEQNGIVWKKIKDGRIAEETVLDGFREKLLALDLDGKIAGILHIINDAAADVVQSDETRILYGQDFFYEELLGLRFKVSVFSFFQTNSRGAEVLYQTAREYIADFISPMPGEAEERIKVEGQERIRDNGTEQANLEDAENEQGKGRTGEWGRPESAGKKQYGMAGQAYSGSTENVQSQEAEERSTVDRGTPGDKIVFDLYSGTGTIAQLMAPVAKKVIGVEIIEEAVEAAKRNAELNSLHNCEFIAGDVLKVIDTIEEKPDIIILDPPRDGIHPKALDKIIRYGVEHILYISCKPTSLARDLEVFLGRGYEVVRAVAVDQFPWTANVETIVALNRIK